MSNPGRPVVDVTGACACQAVSLHFSGAVLSMFLCACEDCQRSTGTGHAAVVLARPRDVTVEGVTRSFARPANSGATLTRHFCPDCGTPLYAQSSRAPGVMMLPAGLFGASAEGWFRPGQVIFARSLRGWDTIAPELPRHATYRDEGALM